MVAPPARPYSVGDSAAAFNRPMNDRLQLLAERIEAAKKAVLALESYMAQMREVIAQTQKAIEEAEALLATGADRE